MGMNSTKSSFKNTEYSLTLSSTNNLYRGLSTIQGELHLNIRKKLRIEKKLHIDLIGQLIENKKSSKTNQIFFTYSFPLVTSHENGIARIIKQQQLTFPFRIPIGINLPPSCEFKEFSIIYYLDIYHDGQLVPIDYILVYTRYQTNHFRRSHRFKRQHEDYRQFFQDRLRKLGFIVVEERLTDEVRLKKNFSNKKKRKNFN